MNIFYIDTDPRRAAEAMVDKHVVKMVLETAQLLSTAHRVLDGIKQVKIQNNRKKTFHILAYPQNVARQWYSLSPSRKRNILMFLLTSLAIWYITGLLSALYITWFITDKSVTYGQVFLIALAGFIVTVMAIGITLSTLLEAIGPVKFFSKKVLWWK